MTHELKTWPIFYQAIWEGNKTFEVRKNDRNFKVGDQLILKEWRLQTESYTGRAMSVDVLYTLSGGQFGIEAGFVVMGISQPEDIDL